MSRLLDKVTPVLLVAAILGGIEMRVAVARLETNLSAVEKRVERIEAVVDANRALAALEYQP